MLRQRMGLGWVTLMGAVLAVAVAACGGAATPAAPAAPPAERVLSSSGTGNANSDDVYSALSQSSRLAAPDVAPAGPKLMSPAEAQSAAPFVYGVPAWAPPGFQFQPQVEVIAPPASDGFASVSLNWQNAAGASIELIISQDPQGLGLSGAGTDRQPVQIGSQLGSLWRQSGFAADRLMLDWTRDGVSDRLSADAEAVTRDDLVRMAASVQ